LLNVLVIIILNAHTGDLKYPFPIPMVDPLQEATMFEELISAFIRVFDTSVMKINTW